MNTHDEPDFQARMTGLIQKVMTIAASSADVRDLVPSLTELVALVQENPSQQRTAMQVLTGLLAEQRGELALAIPGIVEILEYSMHRLKWPTMHDALSDLADSAPDWRVSRAAERVLEAFNDEWSAGDIYHIESNSP